MSSSNWNNAERNTTNAAAQDTVAGYFASGEDAHRAINELMEEGFSANEIGAAFHSSYTGSSGRSSPKPIAEAPEKSPIPSAGAADTPPAGAASGTGAVFPWGLSTGGGTPFAGADQPGPIPGSDIPSNLPKDIPSELESGAGDRGPTRLPTAVPVSTISSATTDSTPAGETVADESWWEKLKHVFGGGDRKETGRREPAAEKEALNYGTGEGHLPVSPGSSYSYSGSAFESSFSGMGIPQEQARRLSRDLQRGGAIVTVRAGSRNATAEAVMERNNGVIRYESAPATGETDWETGQQPQRVEVFGEIHRVYPGYIPEEDVRSRKAS